MTLNKQKMVREIGRRTRLTNREVQDVIEALIDVWTEELVAGGRIEVQDFLVMEVRTMNISDIQGIFKSTESSHYIKKITLRVSKKIRNKLNHP